MLRQTASGIVVVLAAALMQGCALIYVESDQSHTGTTEREFGFLGGCLPLWHYRSVRPVEKEQKADTCPPEEYRPD